MRTQINTTLLLAAIFIGSFTSKIYAAGSGPDIGDPKSVRIGFKFSPNFCYAKMLEGTMKSNGMSIGTSYGLMVDFNIANNPNYWLGTELIVSTIPTKIKTIETLYNNSSGFPVAFNNVQLDYKLQYVQVPITLKLKTNEIGNLVYWGQFGVAPSILIQSKVTTNTTPAYYATGTSGHSPNASANDKYDFGGQTDGTGSFQDNIIFARLPLVLGAGIEGKISGKTTFIAGLRYDNGFTDIFSDKKVKGRNNYIGIQLGIFF